MLHILHFQFYRFTLCDKSAFFLFSSESHAELSLKYIYMPSSNHSGTCANSSLLKNGFGLIKTQTVPSCHSIKEQKKWRNWFICVFFTLLEIPDQQINIETFSTTYHEQYCYALFIFVTNCWSENGKSETRSSWVGEHFTTSWQNATIFFVSIFILHIIHILRLNVLPYVVAI